MNRIGDTKIGKVTPKLNFTYPTVRFPTTHTDIIGHQVTIYETIDEAGRRAFMLILDDDSVIPAKVVQRNATKHLENRISVLEDDLKVLKKKVM